MNALQNIRVVLVRPIYGGNAGSVCRAMMNMGLSDLAIAAPRDDFNEYDAGKWAYSARSIWQNRREFPGLKEAVADCRLVVGTSVREGLYRAHAKTPREWAPLLLNTAGEGRVALVFGPEDNGLGNDDLAYCTGLIRIPSTDAYPSLNISHAVMVCAYELYMASGSVTERGEDSPEASSEIRERMFALWREALLEIGFMEDQKADHMMLGLRRILSRGKLTEIDARIMMGIARQTLWLAQRGRADEKET